MNEEMKCRFWFRKYLKVKLQPTPALTYRTLGGILDFYVVLGPTPEQVVQQYTALIGRPVMPPYWGLGFQLSRYGYENDGEISNLYNDMKAAKIPYDVQYADIDYMERQMDFTLSPKFSNLPSLVDRIKEDGMRFVIILVSVHVTLCAWYMFDLQRNSILHLLVWFLSMFSALHSVTGQRGIVITRSTYPSSGKWAGHWLGDNFSLWDQLYKSIIGMMEFSLFGMSYTGADICGFNYDSNYQMCARWTQLGAFYPYSRNHNGIGYLRQDPAAFDEKFQEISRNVLNTRYTLLPYLYTLMYEAHAHGNTVVRPLLHEFVDDKVTWEIYEQFLWGPALLISPALHPVKVNAYFPDARWYNYYTVIVLLLILFSKVLHITGLQLAVGQEYTLSWEPEKFQDTDKFNCHPYPEPTQSTCEARGCIWEVVSTPGVPHCFYPSNYGYSVSNIQTTAVGLTADLHRNTEFPNPYGSRSPAVDLLRLEVTYHYNDMLQFKIYDPNNKRYEVPVPLFTPNNPESTDANRLYQVEIVNNPFGIQIKRKSTGSVIWNSQVPGFTFSDMFIQIATLLPSQYVYGFGETEHTRFRRDMNWETWGMFTKDQPPGYKLNSYGFQPFYMGMENDGSAHGVLLLNSNAMDVTFQPTPALTYRTIGGILDFYMVLGPNPEEVVQEYTRLIGRPVMPPYWALGFQLCRYGYKNTSEVRDLYNAMRAAKIPYDVQYTDIDYMERKLDFTLGKNFSDLPDFVNEIKADGSRFIIILDPAISGNETSSYETFTKGLQNKVFITWPNSTDIAWAKVLLQIVIMFNVTSKILIVLVLLLILFSKVLHITGLQLAVGQEYTLSWKPEKFQDTDKFNCHPYPEPTQSSCEARGCIWEVSKKKMVKRLMLSCPQIYDPNNKRYEVPVPLFTPNNPESTDANRLYQVEIVNNPFGIQIKRKSTGSVIWNSQVPGFTFSDMFIQIATLLPSQYVYGFGETEHTHLRRDMNWETWGMFTKDQPPGYKLNSYGFQPFYMGMENDGSAHGVLLLNSNAMDVTFQPTPALTYRTIGGILDFYMVLGPNPEEVVQEYTRLIGRPVMPPYWALGFQLCRYGYKNTSEVRDLYNAMRAAKIPYDVQYTDIDYMERKLDFTLGKNFSDLPDFVNEIKADGSRFIIILDPAISGNETSSYETFTKGLQNNVFITWPNSTDIAWAKVWPDYPNVTYPEDSSLEEQLACCRADVAFPDYFRTSTAQWWQEEIENYHANVLQFDGLWTDMNEPSNFIDGAIGGCRNPDLNYPPYMPALVLRERGLSLVTMCMESEQQLPDGTPVRHYDVHNLYGWSQAESTYYGMHNATGERGIIITRSTYPSSGRWAGHWLGDNYARWDQLDKSVIGILEFSLFGISYSGADICGFFNDTTYEMCARWMELGAFYTFSRNHNVLLTRRQDPVSFNSTFEDISRNVLNIRYRLLPYLYTLMHNAHVDGNTVSRPLLHEFPNDKTTWDIYKQFLWGPALMISPVLDQVTVNAYIPDARWYDYHTEADIKVRKQFKTLEAPLEHINLHIRGGYVIPWQVPDITTNASRKNMMGLTVALDDNGAAQGLLYWDDGTTIGKCNKCNTENSIVFLLFILFSKVLHITGLQLAVGQEYTLRWEPKVFQDTDKFNCHPYPEPTQSTCEARGCIWEVVSTPGVPHCFYPSNYGYSVSNIQTTAVGLTADLHRNTEFPNPYGSRSPAVDLLRLEVTYHYNDMLQFKIYDPNNKRYEVPVPLFTPNNPESTDADRLYQVEIVNNPFGIQIKRKSTGSVIWNSQVPGFTFSDMFIQIATLLPSQYVYGFGENEHTHFRRDMNWETWGMFTKDQPPGYKLNSYGFQPFYMGMENDGSAHGVLLLNSNAMDVTFQPTPALTYRTIGGILDFYMVLGPNPEEVVQEYTRLIGRPVMPPYWALGFQLCRYGYKNTSEVRDLYNEMRAAKIPYDVQYTDINYMERKLDFTLSKDFSDLPDFINEIKADGSRFIIILDPAISGNETSSYETFTKGLQNKVFVTWPNSTDIAWAKVWPDYPNVTYPEDSSLEEQLACCRADVAFPDYFRPSTAQWWQEEIENYHASVLQFDGLWTDMNEPSNFIDGAIGGCRNPDLNYPPYMPALVLRERGLSLVTMCMESEQQLPNGTPVRHYDVHNLYGWSQAESTYYGMRNATGERGIIITRSTYPSSGRWAGHWLGDNYARWDQLDKSVIGILEFSLFGISYSGADICGFFNDTTYEMCARWMELGAFYTFSRNHNVLLTRRQDPVAFNSTFEDISRNVLNIRYRLLPYLYTLMHNAHVDGSTVSRPLLHEFPNDKTTWDIYKQFLWGPALMISPVLDQGADIKVRKQFKTLEAPLEHINLHIRGGQMLIHFISHPTHLLSENRSHWTTHRLV
uniref:P-type domain-containing protein n=1 Tax=Anolis carolinensis TaxID=28377 RepID=A0A803TT01_ANOCA